MNASAEDDSVNEKDESLAINTITSEASSAGKEVSTGSLKKVIIYIYISTCFVMQQYSIIFQYLVDYEGDSDEEEEEDDDEANDSPAQKKPRIV